MMSQRTKCAISQSALISEIMKNTWSFVTNTVKQETTLSLIHIFITVYRDSAAPEIKEVSLIPADTIKKYDFGNYYNTNIRVSVTAKDVNVKDGKADYPAVGVKEIRVYSDDDTKVYTGTVSTQVSGTSDATIEVTVPLEEAGTFASLKKVHIKAVDALGNESEAYKLTKIKNHNDIVSDDLMLEKDAPVVKVTPQADGKYENAKDGKTEYWYKEIPTIACEVTDQKDQTNGSGLAARTVTVNGVELTSKTKNFVESITGSDQIVQEDSLTLSASDLPVSYTHLDVYKRQGCGTSVP